MRVLIISSAFPPVVAPESAHAARHLCRHLAAAGVDVHVVTSVGGTGDGDEPFAVHPVMPGWRWRDLPRLIRVWRQVRPDAVLLIYISWLYAFHPMVTWLPVVRRGLRGRPRFVTQFENVGRPDNRWTRMQRAILRVLPRRLSPAWGALLSDSDAVVTLCQPHLDALVRDRPELVGRVIPAPPLLDVTDDADGRRRAAARAELGAGDDAVLAVFFGYVYRGKGIETMIAALPMLPPAVRFVVVGRVTEPDYGRELTDLADRLGVVDRVAWVGHVSDDRASALLRAADVCVLPFDAGVALNNSSVAVAAAHAVAIVTTAGPAVEPALADGRSVVLVPPRDPAALAAAVDRLAGDPAARAAAARGSAALAADHFSWARTVRDTLAVLAGPAGGAPDGRRRR